MLQPKSKLPWKFESYKPDFGDGYDRVVDDNNSSWDVMNNKDYYAAPVDVKDMKYIVQACNNFPEAINLLKIAKEALEELGEFQDGWNEDLDKIEKFLEKIYKDGK